MEGASQSCFLAHAATDLPACLQVAITAGKICTTPAAMKQIGNNGSSFTYVFSRVTDKLIWTSWDANFPGIQTCTGLWLSFRMSSTEPIYILWQYSLCVIFFSFRWIQLTASQGVGSIPTVSSSLCLGSVDGARYGYLVPHIMAITICGLAHKLNVITHTTEMAHRKTRDVAKELLLYIPHISSLFHQLICYITINLHPLYPSLTAFRDDSPSESFTNHSVSLTDSSWLQMPFTHTLVFSLRRLGISSWHLPNSCRGFVCRASTTATPFTSTTTLNVIPLSLQHNTFNHSSHIRRSVMSESEM